MKRKRIHPTASEKLFNNYKRYICFELIETPYTPNYCTFANIENGWQKILRYKKEIEDFLIFKTKIFVRLLDPRNSNSTNPEFLKAFIKLVSKYLSLYTQKNPDIPNIKKAEELLNRALYYQSVYIQNLIIRQEYSKINHKNKRLKRYKKPVKPDPQYQKLLNRKIKIQNYIIETKITRNK